MVSLRPRRIPQLVIEPTKTHGTVITLIPQRLMATETNACTDGLYKNRHAHVKPEPERRRIRSRSRTQLELSAEVRLALKTPDKLEHIVDVHLFVGMNTDSA